MCISKVLTYLKIPHLNPKSPDRVIKCYHLKGKLHRVDSKLRATGTAAIWAEVFWRKNVLLMSLTVGATSFLSLKRRSAHDQDDLLVPFAPLRPRAINNLRLRLNVHTAKHANKNARQRAQRSRGKLLLQNRKRFLVNTTPPRAKTESSRCTTLRFSSYSFPSYPIRGNYRVGRKNVKRVGNKPVFPGILRLDSTQTQSKSPKGWWRWCWWWWRW